MLGGTDNNTDPNEPAYVNHACEQHSFADWEYQGGVVLYILGIVYVFVGIAIICDDYFVDSLEQIVEVLGIPPDVAGATFMAAGSSAPEVATVLISTLIQPGDEGLGDVVGAAVFNSMTIVGLSAICAGKVLDVSPFPFVRDQLFYIVAVALLGIFIIDQKVDWWESFILLCIYGCYIVFMKYNVKIAMWFGKQGEKESKTVVGQLVRTGSKRLSQSYLEGLQVREEERQAAEKATERDGASTDTSPSNSRLGMPYPEGAKEGADLSGIAIHPKFDANGEQLSDHSDTNSDTASTVDEVPCRISNVEPTLSTHEVLIECSAVREVAKYNDKTKGSPYMVDAATETDPPPKKRNWFSLIFFYVRLPYDLLFKIAMPDCARKLCGERWYIWQFTGSITFISLLTYCMLILSTRICCILHIPSVLMGLVFISAGTTVPDALSSIIVARNGEGDMAIANAIGSNIFNILLGLSFPWLLYAWINGEPYTSPALEGNVIVPIIILFCYMFVLPIAFTFSKWRLHPKMGYCLIAMHLFFIVFMLLTSPFGANPPVIKLPGWDRAAKESAH